MAVVSVLLPTYNGSLFLDDQIASILTQSLSDIELLAVDDGSSDDTVQRLTVWAGRDSRLRILPSGENRGQKARLSQLAAAASASLVAIADQDDIWHPEKLRTLKQALGERGLVFGSSWIIDADGVERKKTLLDFIQPLPEPNDRLIYLFKPAVSGHAVLARRDVISPISFMRSQPFDWLQALDAAFGRGIAYVPEAITYHRLHGRNQSNADLASPPNLFRRFGATELRRQRNSRLFQRYEFSERLEYLAFSPMPDFSVNQTFAQAAKLCRDAWFGFDRTAHLRNRRLESQLGSLLLPMAGSGHDETFCRRMLVGLCRSNVNPYSIARQGLTILKDAQTSARVCATRNEEKRLQ